MIPWHQASCYYHPLQIGQIRDFQRNIAPCAIADPSTLELDDFKKMDFINHQNTTAVLGIIAPLVAGFLLRDVKGIGSLASGKAKQELEKQKESLDHQEKTLQNKDEYLEKKEKQLVEREKKLAELEERELVLKKRETSLSESESALLKRERSLDEHEKKLSELEKRESALEERESALTKKEVTLDEKESNLLEREKKLDEKQSSTADVVPEETPAEEGAPSGTSEKEKRINMIKDELQKVLKQVAEEELEDEMEKEAVDALEKAALILCYRKKYYDVMKDELLYFPTVSSTIVNYALMEEAGKYWQELYEDEEEFPMEYSVAMRSVVTQNMGDDDNDMDEEYMTKLALDVEI